MTALERHLLQHQTAFPKVWSFLGSPEEAESISTEHRDQIHFLNQEATNLVSELLEGSYMTRHLTVDPFKDYFNTIERFMDCNNATCKKWLYHRGIPFMKYVLVDRDRSGQAVMLTWKMVIKYWEGLFFAEDLVVFDESLQWGLYYSHSDELYFGSNLQYDGKAEEQKTLLVTELMKKLGNESF